MSEYFAYQGNSPPPLPPLPHFPIVYWNDSPLLTRETENQTVNYDIDEDTEIESISENENDDEETIYLKKSKKIMDDYILLNDEIYQLEEYLNDNKESLNIFLNHLEYNNKILNNNEEIFANHIKSFENINTFLIKLLDEKYNVAEQLSKKVKLISGTLRTKREVTQDCSICYSNVADSVLTCGHTGCNICLNKLTNKQCHICKQKFLQIIKIYN